MITLGGNAELELVDSMDPFSEGIIFSVMPPKKSWRNISNLSGGEKTLSSLALVFALHAYKVGRTHKLRLISSQTEICFLRTAHPVVFHGRNRRRVGFQERVHRRELHQRQNQERTVHHHFPQVRTVVHPFSADDLTDLTPLIVAASPLPSLPSPVIRRLSRSDMFEVSHRLIGIYKVANATKSEDPFLPPFGVGFANCLCCRRFNR